MYAADPQQPASIADHMLQTMLQTMLPIMMIVGGFWLAYVLIKAVFLGGGSRVIYRDRPVERPTVTAAVRDKEPLAEIAATWKSACAARDEFVEGFTEFEVGKNALEDQLFKRCLLKDVSEPLTAAWLDAKEDFDARFPAAQPKSAADAEAALQLARTTRDAWRAAEKNARTKGIGSLSDADAARLDTAQRLLTAARDRGTSAEERRTQVLKISKILGDLHHRPPQEVTVQIEKSLNPWLKSIGAPSLNLAIEA
ncbi:hypothetical protein [Tsukamurella pulmonis]|nr:hypothetical protein [Tsukamurella pulmonis]